MSRGLSVKDSSLISEQRLDLCEDLFAVQRQLDPDLLLQSRIVEIP